MRNFCSWGRRAAHSHPVMSLVVAAACASGIALQGCSQGNGGRSLLSRLSRSEQAASVSTNPGSEGDDQVVAGGLRQGTRREAGVATVTPTESNRRERDGASTRATSPSATPSRDPWIRQPSPTIPDDGRPVASAPRAGTSTAPGSRSVDEWLNQIGTQRPTAQAAPEGLARLSQIEPEESAVTDDPSVGRASLASSQQSNVRPVWASESLPQTQPAAPRVSQSQNIQPAQASRSQAVTAPAPTEADPSVNRRRTDALLQVDALLTRAHDLEAQGKPHDAYRFALVAHQIVQQERLALPPGQERPIDYLDALSAAADTVENDTAWDHQQRGPQSIQQPPTSVASMSQNVQPQSEERWVGSSASQSTTTESPFRQTAGFAEWRTAEESSTANIPSQSPPIRSATHSGGSVPTIRPSSFGQSRESQTQSPQATPATASPSAYGPRFSDPATTQNAEDRSVQPVSSAGELTDPIDTAALSQPQTGRGVNPPAWQHTPVAAQASTPVETALIAPAIEPGQEVAFHQPASAFTGPSFGRQAPVSDANEDSVNANLESESLAVEADAGTESRIAGKSLTFWAMIGGLVLLLACALLRRPNEPRESFH